MTYFNNEFKVLTQEQLERVHALTLEVLRLKGVLFHSALSRDILAAHGAKVDGDCVTFPPSLVEQSLRNCPAGFFWHARDPQKSIYTGEGQTDVFVMQDHGPVYVQERHGERRHGTMQDVINFYKLGQTSRVNAIVGQCTVDPHEADGPNKHLLVTHQLLKHTDKPILSWPVASIEENEKVFRMVEMVMGEGYLSSHYFLTASVCALSPLQYAQESADTIIAYARANQPVTVLTAPMTGVSAPIGDIAALVSQNAELLAGIVLAQAVRPGVPVIYGTATYAADMRSGAFVTGAPISNLIDRAALQLAQSLYHLPTRTLAGNTDAKIPDIQAGYETMQNYIQLLMGGTHMINECLGILDGMMTVSYEKYIIDEEMLRRVDCMMRGLDTSPAAFDIGVLLETPHMEPFLMHESTLAACANQWTPDVACWSNYDTWRAEGCPSILDKAAEKVRERLESAPSDLLGPDLNRDLAAFAERG
ncbi:MAG TPA: trimethylamine methyltransferase family protein [Candidatus Bilophila faecipullorum]|uniref:Trimethylamine methyltransferase family protein n=1 Tax=Candidatus Bilophila faecipullorum TaxID=2838482 RepID=A0A9D1R287_9BACT|nr:trimethylamine methyltransferase family protein [uncultured Bilophila sp.]HIW78757.1 trimethylamine methyltransferase family protein [Candidatus Bilophila faecipullorum]